MPAPQDASHALDLLVEEWCCLRGEAGRRQGRGSRGPGPHSPCARPARAGSCVCKDGGVDYQGYNGTLSIEGDSLVISHHGLAAKGGGLATGVPRRVPLAALSDVRLKPATRMLNGHITFGFGGEQAATLGVNQAASNGNTIVLRHKDNDLFSKVYEYLQGVVRANRESGVDPGAFDVARPGREAHKFERAMDAYGREDIAAAVSRMGWKLGGGRELKKLAEHLHRDEQVRYIAQGTYQTNQGILVLTDQRLLFLFHGIARQSKEDFPLRSISSVQTRSGFVTGELTLYASGNNATISQVVKDDLESLAAAIREGAARLNTRAHPVEPVAARASQSASDPFEALKKLAAMHDAGLVTDEEFTAKRQEILGRM